MKKGINSIKYLFRFMPDKAYLQMYYFARFKKFCDFKNPKSYNEKLQWLKLHDRKPEYAQMVDKYEVKSYVSNLIGNKYIIPSYGVWDSFDEIDFDLLPKQFVLKCTHDSGGLVICKDKDQFDMVAARKKITKCLHTNFYYIGREYAYKNVKPRVLAEKYMEDESGYELKDYKVFCFDGVPKLIQVDFGRYGEHRRNLYTTEWEYINAAMNYPSAPEHQIAKPERLEKMLELAKILSRGMIHVRVDFYSIRDEIYFGEITFFQGSGFVDFVPESFNLELGNCIVLPTEEG